MNIRMHHIQKHILRTLMYNKRAKFSDMRPPRVDSNAYSYHLRVLQKDGLVEKTDKGYRLSPDGLFYVDKVSMDNLETRVQPKIITMIVIQNELGEVLVYSKNKQPFIQSMMLPFGKVHIDDLTIIDAARREMTEKVGVIADDLKHVGECHIRAKINGHLVWNVLAHVHTARLTTKQLQGDKHQWLNKDQRQTHKFVPASEEIIKIALSSKQFFFETFETEW